MERLVNGNGIINPNLIPNPMVGSLLKYWFHSQVFILIQSICIVIPFLSHSIPMNQPCRLGFKSILQVSNS